MLKRALWLLLVLIGPAWGQIGPGGGGTQDENLKQIGGTTVLTGAGATGAGAQRVGVAQDATTVAGSAPGTAGTPSTNVISIQGISGGTSVPVTGAFTYTPSGTQDENLKQIGGTTTLTGAGATGAGAQRVGVAQDVTTVAGSAPGTAGTPSTNVISIQGISGGTSAPVAQPDVRAIDQTTSTLVVNNAITVALNNGEGVTSFVVAGLTASGATLTIEATANIGAATPVWAIANGIQPQTGALFTTLTTDQQFRVNTGGRTGVRLRVSSTGTGSITVSSSASSASSAVALSSPLPAGSNIIGSVNTGPRTFTEVPLDIATTTTGGVAVTALNAGHRTAGGWITNPSTASSAATFCVNTVATATITSSACVGSNNALVPGQTFTLPANGNTVSVISSDATHPFSGEGLN